MKKGSEKISYDQKWRKLQRIPVTDNVRQEQLVLDYRYALYKQTKQSEVAKTYFIGHDPGKEQERHPELWTGWTKEFRKWFKDQMILLDMRG